MSEDSRIIEDRLRKVDKTATKDAERAGKIEALTEIAVQEYASYFYPDIFIIPEDERQAITEKIKKFPPYIISLVLSDDPSDEHLAERIREYNQYDQALLPNQLVSGSAAIQEAIVQGLKDVRNKKAFENSAYSHRALAVFPAQPNLGLNRKISNIHDEPLTKEGFVDDHSQKPESLTSLDGNTTLMLPIKGRQVPRAIELAGWNPDFKVGEKVVDTITPLVHAAHRFNENIEGYCSCWTCRDLNTAFGGQPEQWLSCNVHNKKHRAIINCLTQLQDNFQTLKSDPLLPRLWNTELNPYFGDTSSVPVPMIHSVEQLPDHFHMVILHKKADGNDADYTGVREADRTTPNFFYLAAQLYSAIDPDLSSHLFGGQALTNMLDPITCVVGGDEAEKWSAGDLNVQYRTAGCRYDGDSRYIAAKIQSPQYGPRVDRQRKKHFQDPQNPWVIDGLRNKPKVHPWIQKIQKETDQEIEKHEVRGYLPLKSLMGISRKFFGHWQKD
jgi:hypothetical protein